MAPCDKVRWHRLERAKGPELLCVVWWSAAREAAGGPRDPRGADPRLYLPEGRLPGTRHGPSFWQHPHPGQSSLYGLATRRRADVLDARVLLFGGQALGGRWA